MIYKFPRECFVIDIGPVLMSLSSLWGDPSESVADYSVWA